MKEYPTWSSETGDMRWADRWTDESLAAQARREAYDRDLLARVDRIPRAALSNEDVLSYDLFRYDLAVGVEEQPFRLNLMPVTQRSGIQQLDDTADALPFERPKDFENWNARLRAFPVLMDQIIALLEEGIRTGMTHPKIVMQRVTAQLDKQIVDDPARSPFFAPYVKKPREPYATLAKALVTSSVVPAFKKLRAFWTEKYLPACKDEVGAWNLPQGKAMYEHLVRAHTTTKLGPDEVHAIGLREVARIRA